MKKKALAPTHGGKREGAGRPTFGDSKKVTKGLCLYSDVAQFLSEADGKSQSEVANDAIRSSKAFANWLAEHSRKK